MTLRFVLASASPARLRTLRNAGLSPDVIVSNFDESQVHAPTTVELVQKLATAKAALVAQQISGEALVLGCDSMLELDGAQLGKPGSASDAAARWRQMRGREGVLHTGHALWDVASGRVVEAVASTTVAFADVTDDEIAEYCATGEPSEVAGGFTVDGLGGWFVEGIGGDHHNVVGVSLPLLRRMLSDLGVRLADLGYPAPGLA